MPPCALPDPPPPPSPSPQLPAPLPIISKHTPFGANTPTANLPIQPLLRLHRKHHRKPIMALLDLLDDRLPRQSLKRGRPPRLLAVRLLERLAL